jgi:hypothetical protein
MPATGMQPEGQYRMFSRKAIATTVAVAAALGGVALASGSASASTHSPQFRRATATVTATPDMFRSLGQGAVNTSNGEAGYFTWASTAFQEVQTNLTPLAPAEQAGANGSLGIELTSVVGANANGNILPGTVPGSLSCNLAQLGFVWNPAEQAYDVWEATGTTTYDPTATNPYLGGTKVNVCTSGGALNPAPGTTYQDGFTVVTDTTSQVLGDDSSGEGIAVGQQVFLQLEKHGSDFTASAWDTNPNDDNTGGPVDVAFPGTFGSAHWAGAGTVVDITDRTPATPLSGEEAMFSELRAANATHTTHGRNHAYTLKIFNTWLSQEVVSSANGTSADAPAVTPANSLVVKTGPGTFNLYTGSPVGA